ncbi:MAG: hypothetical protein HZA32_17470 [Opitutae bacterium]|nr:hypothetical protein [Opitutae bacterium]
MKPPPHSTVNLLRRLRHSRSLVSARQHEALARIGERARIPRRQERRADRASTRTAHRAPVTIYFAQLGP